MADRNNEFIIEDGMVMEYVGNGEQVVIPERVKDIFFEAFLGWLLLLV